MFVTTLSDGSVHPDMVSGLTTDDVSSLLYMETFHKSVIWVFCCNVEREIRRQPELTYCTLIYITLIANPSFLLWNRRVLITVYAPFEAMQFMELL